MASGVMDPVLVHALLAGAAAYARVEGMKAENGHRLRCGMSIAYGDDQFFAEAKLLDELAIQARNCSQ